MTDKTISLLEHKEQADADVVDTLKKWLRDARAGRIRNVFLFGQESGPEKATRFSQGGVWKLSELAGALEQQAFEARLELSDYVESAPDEDDE